MTKIAVVTGAAGGMGRAIVARLRTDGCHVVGLDVAADGLAEMAQDGAWTATGDFTLADLFLYSIVRGLQLSPQGEVGIAQCDHLSAWLAVTENRASVRATRWASEP